MAWPTFTMLNPCHLARFIFHSACPACEGGVLYYSGIECAYRLHFWTVAKQGNLGARPGVYFPNSCMADDSLYLEYFSFKIFSAG
jgi:hypothetical protein